VVFVTFEGDQVVSVRRHGEMAEPDAKAAEPEDPEDAPAPAEHGSAGSDSAGSTTPQPYQPLIHAPFN
jgi:hypothetical protein